MLETQTDRAPVVNDIKAEQGPREHLVSVCTIWHSVKFTLQTLVGNVQIPELTVRLVCTNRTNDRLIVGNYDATILELQGEVRSEHK